LEQPRSSQRYSGKKAGKDTALLQRMRTLSRENPRYGYRRVWALLRREGWEVNKKRVQRLWCDEGLRVPHRKRKRRRPGASDADGKRLCASHPNHAWAIDFQTDETADGRQLRLLNVVDEFTREGLATEAERSITADATVATLDRLARERGVFPEHIRMDNGPELTAHALRDWCRRSGAGSAYIEPGSPWQNAYVESCNARVRDEVLDVELFASLAEAKLVVAEWLAAYNAEHPHSVLGMLPPARFAASWRH
jgi:putative transposase